MVIQRFDLFPDDPTYTLKIKQTLTIKPFNFQMRVKLRPGYAENRPTLLSTIPKEVTSDKSNITTIFADKGSRGKGIVILYGSNSGSCEGFAHNIGEDAGKM